MLYVLAQICCVVLVCEGCNSSGVSIGKCLACIIHWVSSGVGVRCKFSSVFLRWILLIFFNKNIDLVNGNFIQS